MTWTSPVSQQWLLRTPTPWPRRNQPPELLLIRQRAAPQTPVNAFATYTGPVAGCGVALQKSGGIM